MPIASILHGSSIMRPLETAGCTCRSSGFRARAATLAASVVLTVAAAPQVGAATLGSTTLIAIVANEFPNSEPFQLFDIAVTPPGSRDPDVRAAELLFSNTFGGQFPDPVNPSYNVFASSEAKGDGSYGVGASGILFGEEKWIGEAGVYITFTNDGTGPAILDAEFSIPRMEVSIAGYPGQRDIQAYASAVGGYTIREPDVFDPVAEGQFFDLWMDATKATPSASDPLGVTFNWSDDLQGVMETGWEPTFIEEDIDGRGFMLASMVMEEFRVGVRSPELAPGQSLILYILGDAFFEVGGAGVEGGAQALVGDPFNPRLAGGPLIMFPAGGDDPGPGDPPPVIPLPAGVWLLLSGVGALVLARRRRA